MSSSYDRKLIEENSVTALNVSVFFSWNLFVINYESINEVGNIT